MNLLEGIPPEVVAQFPRVWGTNRAGMGVRTIDPRAVKAWRERGQIVRAEARSSSDKTSTASLPKPSGKSPIFRGDPDALEVLLAEPGERQDHQLAQAIIQAVCDLHAVDRDMIIGNRRASEIVTARFHAIYEVRRQCWWLSTTQIGRLFGWRDHTTVMNAVRMWPRRAKAMGTEPVVSGDRPIESGPYTPADLDRMEAFWAEGMKPAQIARLMGRTASGISGIAYRYRSRFPILEPKAPIDRGVIASLLREGRTVREVANKMCCSERLVRRVAQKGAA